MADGYIYILVPGSLPYDVDDHVLKIGKTISIEGRMSQYPKGTQILRLYRVSSYDEREQSLLAHMRKFFMNEENIGIEYFRCKDPFEFVKQVDVFISGAIPNSIKKNTKPETDLHQQVFDILGPLLILKKGTMIDDQPGSDISVADTFPKELTAVKRIISNCLGVSITSKYPQSKRCRYQVSDEVESFLSLSGKFHKWFINSTNFKTTGNMNDRVDIRQVCESFCTCILNRSLSYKEFCHIQRHIQTYRVVLRGQTIMGLSYNGEKISFDKNDYAPKEYTIPYHPNAFINGSDCPFSDVANTIWIKNKENINKVLCVWGLQDRPQDESLFHILGLNRYSDGDNKYDKLYEQALLFSAIRQIIMLNHDVTTYHHIRSSSKLSRKFYWGMKILYTITNARDRTKLIYDAYMTTVVSKQCSEQMALFIESTADEELRQIRRLYDMDKRNYKVEHLRNPTSRVFTGFMSNILVNTFGFKVKSCITGTRKRNIDSSNWKWLFDHGIPLMSKTLDELLQEIAGR